VKGLAVAVAATIVGFFMILAFALIVALYTFFTIYAMTKGSTFDSNHLNVGVMYAGIAVITTLLICLLGVAVWGIDKAIGPVRAKRGGED
jgi:hypothetical protein